MNDRSPTIDRRTWLGGMLAASLMPWHRALADTNGSRETKLGPFCAFTKFLQDQSYPELAATIKELGFDGIEATVRKGGHVLPERVEDDLPKMVEALRDQDLEITIMASDVLEADELSQRVLGTAAELGVKRYRMGFHRYVPNRPVLEQMNEIRPKIDDLVALNRELGIQALYQNHSGAKYMGSTLWDLHQLIKDHPVDLIASAFDIRHATIEAGLSWPVIYSLMRPHIGAIYVKDFDWDGKKAKHVPLGTGRVDEKFFEMVAAEPFVGPYSLHVEYLKVEGVQENIKALRRDFAQLKSWLA